MDFSLTLDLAQLLFTIIGVVSGITLFIQSNIEKKNTFILSIYDRFYNDVDIKKILYYVDRDEHLDKIKYLGEYEFEADKTLRFLDFIGKLVKDKQLKKNDIYSFKYEIGVILNNLEVKHYLQSLLDEGIILDNLEYLNFK
jgi:hypothetical protein